MDDFVGKVAVVTGGGEGIGRGIAHALADVGARVAVVDIDGEAAKHVAGELEGAKAFEADVSSAEDMYALAEDVESSLGMASILCNNAGVLLEGSLVESEMTDWQWVLGVNLYGIVNGVQAFIPRIRASGNEAHIVNTGSMAGLAPRLGGFAGVYSASKAAVVSFSEMLRAELAEDNIGVSVLCPSTVSTRIWEAARNRPAEMGHGETVSRPARVDQAIAGLDVGPLVVQGIIENRAYIFTGADTRPRIEARGAAILADVASFEEDAS